MKKDWRPPVVKVAAQENKGIDELIDKIDDHKSYLIESGTFQERRIERLKMEIIESIKNKLMKNIFDKIQEKEFSSRLQQVIDKKIDPYTFADELYKDVFN